MGCIQIRNTAKPIIYGNLKTENTSISDQRFKNIKIKEGRLINEQKGSPYDYYDELQILGEGSFGKVFEVVKKDSKVHRAMKKINKDKFKINYEEELSLINEINILKTLDHPNIMKIYEYFNTEHNIYIISELCTGGELFDKITAEKHFSEALSQRVMKQLLSAVDFCHLNQVIHRDLKPENILIEKLNEESIQIKVIDFGTSAKLIKGSMCHKLIGTPFYIAPEVLNNNYNEKCDLWSCGVIMYILLSGGPPFYGVNDEEICAKVIKGEFSFNQPEWDDVSDTAKSLIKSLLTKDIDKRFSAKEALLHPWINSVRPNNVEKKTVRHIANNLKKFYADQKIQQVTLAYIVHNLINKEEVNKLRDCFHKFDTNGDGHLTKEELLSGLLEIMDKREAEKEVERLMECIDADGNGYIEYEEFLRASLDKEKLLTEKNLKIVFDFLDKDKSGKISSDEIKEVLVNDGVIDDTVWKDIIGQGDLDGDGEIDLNEFIIMMNKVQIGV